MFAAYGRYPGRVGHLASGSCGSQWRASVPSTGTMAVCVSRGSALSALSDVALLRKPSFLILGSKVFTSAANWQRMACHGGRARPVPTIGSYNSVGSVLLRARGNWQLTLAAGITPGQKGGDQNRDHDARTPKARHLHVTYVYCQPRSPSTALENQRHSTKAPPFSIGTARGPKPGQPPP